MRLQVPLFSHLSTFLTFWHRHRPPAHSAMVSSQSWADRAIDISKYFKTLHYLPCRSCSCPLRPGTTRACCRCPDHTRTEQWGSRGLVRLHALGTLHEVLLMLCFALQAAPNCCHAPSINARCFKVPNIQYLILPFFMHSAVETHSYFFSKRHRKFSHLKVDKMSQLSHTSLQAAGCSVLTCSRSLWRCCSGGRCCCSQPWSRSLSRRCCRCRTSRRLTLVSTS